MGATMAPDALEYDESEFFADELPAGEPICHPKQPVSAALFSHESDSEDGLELSDGSSSEDEDAVEEHLRLRLQSLQSSLDQPTPMDGAEDLGTSHGSHVGSLKTFGSGRLRREYGSENDLAASMPVASAPYMIQSHRRRATSAAEVGYCKLGTSMPIGIPLMQRRHSMIEGASEAPEEEFVPPHLVERQASDDLRDLFFQSVGGLSPNAAMKRDRLAQRNHIMRATGFLETAPISGPIGEITDTVRNSLTAGVAMPTRPPPRVPTQTSSLSAALGLGTTPQ